MCRMFVIKFENFVPKLVRPMNAFISFENARQFARSLCLKGKSDWARWAKSEDRPKNIPSAPSKTYSKKGWAGWGDFLGTGNKAPKNYNYRPFLEARLFVRTLGLKDTTEWKQWANSDKRPQDIPKSPAQAYRKKGWINLADFLGGKVIPRKSDLLPILGPRPS